MNRTSEFRFAIIVPVFNEEELLPELFDRLGGFLGHSPFSSCVLFVNDGSTDSSSALISDACSRRDDFFYISFERNSGLSTALKAGFDICFSEYCGYIDADLQTDPVDFNLLLPLLRDNFMVTGVREHRDDSFAKVLQSRIANGFRRLMTGDGALDTCCPLKVFRTESAKRFPLFKGMHRFFPALVLLQDGGSYAQVPVSHFPRKAGQSKFGFRNRFPGPLVDCFIYRWMKSRAIRYNILSANL